MFLRGRIKANCSAFIPPTEKGGNKQSSVGTDSESEASPQPYDRGWPLAFAPDEAGNLVQFKLEDRSGAWTPERISTLPNESHRRPVLVSTGGGVKVFDLNVAM